MSSNNKRDIIVQRQPILNNKTESGSSTERPNFQLSDIKNAIPKHCFDRSLLISLRYLLADLCKVAILGTAMFYYLRLFSGSCPLLVNVLVQVVYTAFQGVFFTGLWVLAHECGHGAFSPFQTLNDIIGFIVHSMLYAPYFSWQHTHAMHHHYSGNMEKDEVWVPARSSIIKDDEGTEAQSSNKQTKQKSHLDAWYTILVMFTVGWPAYLIFNATGHETSDFASHFLPNCSLFSNMKKSKRWKVHLSTFGLVAWTAFLIYTPYLFPGFTYSMLLRLYALPLSVNFFFLTSITYLQHTDLRLPNFENSEWNWLRGTLATCDRTMGSFLDDQLHDIHVTHVCHHLFSKLPFYHSREATKHIKEVLGDYYQHEEENYFISLYKTLLSCSHLKEEKGILWWITHA